MNPTPMVSSTPIDCLPGSTIRARTPTTSPVTIALMIPLVSIRLRSLGQPESSMGRPLRGREG